MHNSPAQSLPQCAPSKPTFAREELTPHLFSELIPLLRAHWKEIAHYQDIPLEPDMKAYDLAYKSGILRIFTIRVEVAVYGYSVFFVRKNPHYSSSLQASQDILYLSPEFRGRLTGFKFIKWCDDQLRKEGVQVVYHHVKEAHNFGPMLVRIGYEPVDRVYGRRLDLGEP